MTDFLKFFLLGLGAGGIYALLALGIVLVYRGSGIVNFASGGMALFGASVFVETRDSVGTPAAVVIGVVATVNWAAGGALAAVAGVLLVPIVGLSASSLTLTIVPALSAALVGAFASFPLTLLGGLLIGVLESEATRYVHAPGWATAVPFL